MSASTYTSIGSDRCERETLYWRLMFLSTVINNIHHFDICLDKTDTAGFAALIDDIADKVFPEHRHSGAA